MHLLSSFDVGDAALAIEDNSLWATPEYNLDRATDWPEQFGRHNLQGSPVSYAPFEPLMMWNVAPVLICLTVSSLPVQGEAID